MEKSKSEDKEDVKNNKSTKKEVAKKEKVVSDKETKNKTNTSKKKSDKKAETEKSETKKAKTEKSETKKSETAKSEIKKSETTKVENATTNQTEKVAGEVTIEIEDTPKKKKGSVVLGLIGGILGGLIATIPWILMYIYGNMILSALSIFIAVGIFYGYKLFNGKINKALPVIIIVLSLIIVAVTTLAIIPGIILVQDGIPINMDTIKNLYTDKEFLDALTKDAAISILFTIIGAGAISSTINRKIKNGESEDISLTESKEETNQAKPKSKKIEKIATVIIGLILIIAMGATVYIEKTGILKSVEVADGEINFTIKGDWEEYSSYYADEYTYTRYITGKEPTEEELNQEESNQEEIDYSLYPAFFSVTHFKIDTEQIKSIDDIKTSLDEYFNSLEEKPELFEGNVIQTQKGYNAYYIKMKDTSSVARIEYICYILHNDEMATINAYSFTLEDADELEKTIKQTIDSFRWEA